MGDNRYSLDQRLPFLLESILLFMRPVPTAASDRQDSQDMVAGLHSHFPEFHSLLDPLLLSPFA